MSNNYVEESQLEKLKRKTKDAPIFPIGIAGCAIMCAVAAYKYKTRGNTKTSVFLMQTRVAAQGTVVAVLTAGLAYQMAKTYLWKDDEHNEK